MTKDEFHRDLWLEQIVDKDEEYLIDTPLSEIIKEADKYIGIGVELPLKLSGVEFGK